MINDLILVIAGIVIFMIPAILQKQKDFSRAVLLSGSFVTVVKLVILISEIERNLSASNEAYSEYTVSAFLLMVFVNFRPLLFRHPTFCNVFGVQIGQPGTKGLDRNGCATSIRHSRSALTTR